MCHNEQEANGMAQDSMPDDNWDWETPEERRPRRLDEDGDSYGFPIVWLVIGGLAGLLTVGLIALGVARLVSKQQPPPTPTVLPTAVLPPTPTMVASMMEEPSATPEPTVEVLPTAPQVINTPTPIPPTPTAAAESEQPPAAPAQIQVGSYVKVVNTGGSGLSLRAGPGTNNARLMVADATSVMEVVGGPKDDEQGELDDAGAIYQWWYLKYTDGTEGWARADFLEATTAP
jgi:hypothetical protein